MKNNQIKILDLKGIITERKDLPGRLNIWSGRKKKSANFKFGQLRWSNLRNRKNKKVRKMNNDLWDTKCPNIHIIRVCIWEEEGKQAERIFEEIMPASFSTFMKNTDIHIPEA